VAYSVLLGDPRAVGTGNPPADVNNLNDVVAGMGGYFNAWNTAFSGGADPTASTDSAPALNAMLSAAPVGAPCFLPPIYYNGSAWEQAKYKINSTVTVPPGVNWYGNSRALGIPVGDYGIGGLPLYGALIQPSGTFSDDMAIELEYNTGTQYGGQQLRGFTVDGSNLPAGAVWGIHAFAVAAVTLREMSVYSMTSDGLHAAAGGSGGPPDFWDVAFCKFSDCVGNGVYIDGMADGWWLEVECTANQDNGWSIINCNNSRFLACKAEGNTLAGFAPYSVAGFTGDLKFTACTCEENAQDGFYITGDSGGDGIYTLMSCKSVDDGSNTGSGGGGFAGIRANAFSGTVIVSDFVAQQGPDTNPQYGVSVTNTNYFRIDNSVLSGYTAPFHNGGGNTTLLVGRGVGFGATGSVTGSNLTDPWGASDLGYASVAFDPLMQTSTGTANLITAGTLNLIGLQLRIPYTIADLDLWVIGAGAGLTTALAGLYNSAGTLIGHTGSQTTGWASASTTGPVQLALTAQATNSLTDLVPGLYWVGLLAAGTTMPSFSQAPGSAAGSGNVVTNGRIASAAVARYATNGSGLSALPTSITPSGFTQSHVAAWWAGIH
jgi:hypothetical protein